MSTDPQSLQAEIDKQPISAHFDISQFGQELRGPITLRKPICVDGRNRVTLISTSSSPIVRIESHRVELRNLILDATSTDGERRIALEADPPERVKFRNVGIWGPGLIYGIPDQSNEWALPQIVELGSLACAYDHVRELPVRVPSECKISSELTELVVLSPRIDPGDHRIELCVRARKMRPGTSLYGQLHIRAGEIWRRILVTGHVVSEAESSRSHAGGERSGGSRMASAIAAGQQASAPPACVGLPDQAFQSDGAIHPGSQSPTPSNTGAVPSSPALVVEYTEATGSGDRGPTRPAGLPTPRTESRGIMAAALLAIIVPAGAAAYLIGDQLRQSARLSTMMQAVELAELGRWNEGQRLLERVPGTMMPDQVALLQRVAQSRLRAIPMAEDQENGVRLASAGRCRGLGELFVWAAEHGSIEAWEWAAQSQYCAAQLLAAAGAPRDEELNRAVDAYQKAAAVYAAQSRPERASRCLALRRQCQEAAKGEPGTESRGIH